MTEPKLFGMATMEELMDDPNAETGKPGMTFEQFQATKERVDRATFCERINVEEEFITAAHVLAYYDGFTWIEDNEGKGYFLLIERSEYISDNLEELERKLYDWACDEGYFEKEGN